MPATFTKPARQRYRNTSDAPQPFEGRLVPPGRTVTTPDDAVARARPLEGRLIRSGVFAPADPAPARKPAPKANKG